VKVREQKYNIPRTWHGGVSVSTFGAIGNGSK